MNIQRRRRSQTNTFPRNIKPIEGDRRIDYDCLDLSPPAIKRRNIDDVSDSAVRLLSKIIEEAILLSIRGH
jgi:hypothetical protein